MEKEKKTVPETQLTPLTYKLGISLLQFMSQHHRMDGLNSRDKLGLFHWELGMGGVVAKFGVYSESVESRVGEYYVIHEHVNRWQLSDVGVGSENHATRKNNKFLLILTCKF